MHLADESIILLQAYPNQPACV